MQRAAFTFMGCALADRNIFDVSPRDLAARSAERSILGITEQMQPKAPLTLDTVSRRHQVPQNVLEAVIEEAGLPEDQALQFADEFATRLGAELQSGKPMPDAMRSVFGADAPVDGVLQRAIEIAGAGGEAQVEDVAPDDGSAVGDAGRMLAGGVVKGSGNVVAGAGRGYDAVRPQMNVDTKIDPETGRPTITPREGPAPEAEIVTNTRRAGADLVAKGKTIQGGVSAASRDAIRQSTPDGDLFAPSTWSLGSEPSLRGYAMLTADVLGSLAPVVLASVVTRSPIGGGVVGAAQSGGAAAEEARRIVQEAGPERLAEESAYYRELVAKGASPEEATELTTQAAERMAAMYAAPIGGFGGAITGQIATRGLAPLAGKSVATRVAGTAAVSGAEEGVQEVAESVAGRFGTEQGSGLDVDLTEGTFGDAILGMLAGAPIGAASGLRDPEGRDDDEPPAPPLDPASPPAPPAPDSPGPAPAAPGGNPIFSDPGRINQPAPEAPSGPEDLARPPQGPLSRAAQAVAPAPAAPEPILGNIPKGGLVDIAVSGGDTIQGEFLTESDEGIEIKVEGNPIFIPREEIDQGEVTLTPVNPLRRGIRPEDVDTSPMSADVGTGSGAALNRIPGRKTPEALLKRPFTNRVRRAVGGIDPTGPAAAELNQRGINPQTATGLFAEGGAKTLDTLGAQDWGELAYMIGTDETGNYLDQNAVIDAIAEEFSGNPLRDSTQIDLAEKAQSRRLQAEAIERGFEVDDLGMVEVEPNPLTIPHPESDISTGPERTESILRALKSVQQEIGADLTQAERIFAFDALDQNGGTVEDVIWRLLEREVETDTDGKAPAASPYPDTPFGEQDAPGGRGVQGALPGAEGDGRPASTPGSEGQGGTQLEDAGVGGRQSPADRPSVAGEPATQDQWWRNLPRARHAAKQVGYDRESVGDAAWTDLPRLVATVNQRLRIMEFTDLLAPEEAEAASGDAPALPETPALPAPEATEAAKPAKPKARPERPTGFTFKLADRLEDRDNRVIAKYRDSNAGEIVSQIDGIARRAEAAMREAGLDIRQFDDEGRGPDGNVNQMALVIAEARDKAATLAEAMRAAKTGDLDYPARDENTGEFEDDGSPMAEALTFLDTVEAQGLPVDEIIEPDSIANPDEADLAEMAEADIFPAPSETKSIATLEKKGPWIEQDAATAQIAEWKRIAAEIGKTDENRNKVVISLYDYTGAWSQPWADAGYNVIRHDIKSGTDVRASAFVYDRIREYRAAGMEIVGVLSACPCTTFSGAGARWWQDVHDVKSPEAVEKVFGRAGLLSGAESPLAYNVMLYEATRDVIAVANPTRFHVLENPIGRIQEATGLSKPTLRFHPSNFGDPYTKQTQLFGPFRTDLPLANVKATDGSKMQSKLRGDDPLGKEQRSTTPEGFAYAFFMANDPAARKQMGESTQTEATPAGQQALIPGVAPVKDKDRAETTMSKPKRGGAAPLPEGGLFDEGARSQLDMFAADQAPAAPTPGKGDAPLADYSSVEVNGYEGATRDDGADAPAKAAFLDDARRYARKLASILTKEDGYKPAKDRKGKDMAPVRVNQGGIAGSGDVYLSLMSPDGEIEVSLTINADGSMRSRKNGVFMNLQHRKDGQFIGGNTYPDTTLSPSDLAASIRGTTITKAAGAAPKEPAATTIDESSANDPKMPNGYQLTSIRRLTKPEAKAEGVGWPAMKAVVKRDRPYTYSLESGISEISRAEAITIALRRAQKGAQEPEAPAAVPADDFDAMFDDLLDELAPQEAPAQDQIAAQVEAAAAEANPNPTDGQKEAGAGRDVGKAVPRASEGDIIEGLPEWASSPEIVNRTDSDPAGESGWVDAGMLTANTSVQVRSARDRTADGTRGILQIRLTDEVGGDFINGVWTWQQLGSETFDSLGMSSLSVEQYVGSYSSEATERMSEDLGVDAEDGDAIWNAYAAEIKSMVGKAMAAAQVDAAAAEVEANPTDAQKEAGNYRKGHVRWNGLDLTIENAKGSERSGTDPDGNAWSVTMPAHYGYFRMTEGADGEHIDFYMGDVPDSDYVLFVDQVDAETGAFDEHKIMVGFTARGAALAAYRGAFDDGRADERIGNIFESNVAQLKSWLESTSDSGFDSTKPVTGKLTFPFKKAGKAKAEAEPATGWRDNKHLALFKRVMADPSNSLDNMRAGVFPDVAEYADWLGGLSDADLDKIGPVFRADYNPFHGATFLGNGGIEQALEDFATVGVTRDAAKPGSEGTRPAGEAAKSAAKNTAKGVDAALDGLIDLFGGKDQINSGLTFSRETYEKAKPMFIEAARHFGAAGQDIREVMRAVIQALLDKGLPRDGVKNMQPYVVQFTKDVQSGTVSISNNEDATDEPAGDRPNGDGPVEGGAPDRGGETATGADAGRGAGDGETGGGGDGDADGGRDGPAPSGERGDPRVSGGQPTGPVKPTDRSGESPGNFIITTETGVGTGTDGKKIEANLAALRLLKTLEAERRHATADEQSALARYVGWGGLKTVFDPKKAGATDMFGRAQTELKTLLTTDEYNAARQSIRNAHYTAPQIVLSMWQAMGHFGFNGGRALEPTVGSGNFLGLQAEGVGEQIAKQTEWHAAELDSVTGRIASYIYPEANIMAGTGFQDAPFMPGAFDIAIGNPPFGSNIVRDKLRAHLDGQKVHHYIINKTGEHLRPGGIMGMVITHRFLDTADDASRESRALIAKQFRMIGAVRLPNDAFLANANTEVVTDIVFFQKLKEGEQAERNPAWLDTDGAIEVDGQSVRVNRYYQENPGHILGRSAMDGTMYAGRGEGEYTVHGDGRDLADALSRVIREDWADQQGVLGDRVAKLEAVAAVQTRSTLPVFGMMIDEEGKVIRRGFDGPNGEHTLTEITAESYWSDLAEEYDTLTKAIGDLRDTTSAGGIPSKDVIDAVMEAGRIAFNASGTRKPKPTSAEKAVYDIVDAMAVPETFEWTFDAGLASVSDTARRRRLGEARFAKIKGLLDLRGKALALLRAEMTTQEENSGPLEKRRRELARAYKAFVKKHGFVNNPQNVGVMDGDTGIEFGLEVAYEPKSDMGPEKATPSPLMDKRVNYPRREITKADNPEAALTVSMTERGRVDLAYIAKLTGQSAADVREALATGDKPMIFFDPTTERWEHVEEYLSGNVKEKLRVAQLNDMEANVRALEAALPAPLPKERIKPTIRGQWIPQQVFNDFLRDLGVRDPMVRIYPSTGMVNVDGGSVKLSEFGIQFKHGRKSVTDIMQSAMSGKTMTVNDKDEGGKTVKNEEATKEVNALADRMAKVFSEWAYADNDRADQIVEAYNEKMNTHVQRRYDGEKYLRTRGANPAISLRRSQKNASWRMIQSPTTLLDHVVGAGKTFTVIAGVQERVNLGLSRKPMIAVPNHLVTQWQKDYQLLYPGSNVLAATPDDFAKKNRRRLFARIATGKYDAIIIGHSSLGFIENPAKDEKAIIDEQTKALQEAMELARVNGESKRTLAQMETRLENYKAKLDALSERRRDEMGFDFASMGVDFLAVDEAHEFKNLEYSTAGERLVGMNDPKGSNKAFDLYVKVRGLQGRDGAVTFATGTPLSNSLVEVYSMMKYLAYNDLTARMQSAFDAWSGAFVEAETRFEYTATQTLKERKVMARLTNLDALSQIYLGFADVIDRNRLEEMYTADVKAKNKADGGSRLERFPTPKVKGGGRRLLSAPATTTQTEFTNYLVARMGGIKENASNKDYMKKDNALWVLSDARKASLDPRTVDPTLPRDDNGKVMRSAREIKRIYDKWSEDRGAQLVFSDMSTPSGRAEAQARSLLRKSVEVLQTKADAKRTLEGWQAEGKTYQDQWDAVLRLFDAELTDDATTGARRDALEDYLLNVESDEPASTMLVADTGFSVYDDLRTVLMDMGIPENQIEFIHDHDTPKAKAKLFDRVNAGHVRVLVGSTPKMGAGMNAQERLVGLHHLDAPWRPSDVEQREGRIIRQGNKLYERDPDGFDVEILAYSTEGTSDVVLWQILERKARAIESFRSGELDALEEEGSDADSYADFMAASTGNPVFRLKMESEKRVTDLQSETSGRRLAKMQAESFLSNRKESLVTLNRSLKALGQVDVTKATVSYDGTKAPASDLAKAKQEARKKYEEDYARYLERRADIEAQRADLEQQGKPEKDWPNLPSPPSQPTLLNKWMLENSEYARMIEKVLNDIDGMLGAGTRVVDMGEARVIATVQKDGGGAVIFVKAQVGGRDFDVGSAVVSTARKATTVQRFFDPEYIGDILTERKAQIERRLAAIERDTPDMERVAATEVDEKPLRSERDKLAYLKAMVAMAEARADVDRQGKPNRFIERDTKGRSMSTTGAQIFTERRDFEFDGETYSGTGIGRAESGKVGDQKYTRMYEATRKSDGALVAIMTHADSVSQEPVAVAVAAPPEGYSIAVEADAKARRRAPQATEPRSDVGKLTAALNAELERADIGARVKASVWRKIEQGPFTLDGFYRAGDIGVALDAADPLGTMRHEIIHALRDKALWGGEQGLFTAPEWRELVRAARADDTLMAQVARDYPDLTTATAQSEEAVAELYRRWMRGRDTAGPVARVLMRIRDTLNALGNALVGRGYASAGRTFHQIATGQIGRRGKGPDRTPPSGGGRSAKAKRAYHGSPSDFDRFSAEYMGSGEGAQAFGWGLYFADMKDVAERYRDDLAKKKIRLRKGSDGSPAEVEALDFIAYNFHNAMDEARPSDIPSDVFTDWADMIESGELDGDADLAAALRRIDPADLELSKGKLYTVEIPEESDLLDYDKPLTQQPSGVQKKLKSLYDLPYKAISTGGLVSLGDYFLNNPTGREILAAVRQAATTDRVNDTGRFAETGSRDRAAALALRDAGIPGHRFFDGRSRSAGEGTRNYVIYDDAAIAITAKAKRRSRGSEPEPSRWPTVQNRNMKQGISDLLSDTLTQSMSGAKGANLLALVPGRPLLNELGVKLPALRSYLRIKEAMDALRNEKHGQIDEIAQRWRRLIGKNPKANTKMMDLMHEATLSGIDPALPFVEKAHTRDRHIMKAYPPSTITYQEAADRIAEDSRNRAKYDELRAIYDSLPQALRAMYVEVRDAYSDLDHEFQKAIEANAEKAMTIAVRRAERAHERRMEEIKDEGLTGAAKDDAIEEAEKKLKTAKVQNRWSKGARLRQLRATFETNTLTGPYFPLARFGDFFVTLRDKEGKVVSFSRFERRRDQRLYADEMKAGGWDVESGVMQEINARDMVDPNFVADIEGLLEEINAGSGIMDTIWQRWLTTLPDMSTRKNRIHRKGTPGFEGDAFRAFGHQMFHGAHQLARLTHSLDLSEQLDVAEQEVRIADDPERAGLVLAEVRRRHDYVMNPKGAWWSQAATSAAFVYYLSMTPAAAIVNLTQTSVFGTAILGAYQGKNGQIVAAKQLTRALTDWASGRTFTEKSKNLTEDERRAMKEAYERGTVDKSQAHDLAGVGETGVEYNAVRTKVMGAISWFFHHAERTNREVTFLAAYRMARAKGLDHNSAVDKGADLTWKTHFDYQNTSRPRLMQNDYMRVAFVFKNFQINALWRLFRDLHQTFNASDEATKDEARRQLVGITAQMFLHAGVKGVWGYSLTMALLAMFLPGDEDDLEKSMEMALMAYLPRDAAGMILNGVPGHALGIDLQSRVGMPDLWFRSPDRQLEGEDEYNYWVQQLLGAVPGMIQNVKRGADQIAEGNYWRGTETMMPKAIRDQLRAIRYANDGAETYRGDPIIDEFAIREIFTQAIGFTPARLSERYDQNRRLKNEERKILDERSRIMGEAAKSLMEGNGLPDALLKKIEQFNSRVPEYVIDNAALRRSISSRAGASARNQGGVILNPRLNERLRSDAAPSLYSE